MEIEELDYVPEQVSCVIVNGNYIPTYNVEVLNVEEDIYGRDLITFKYLEKTMQSLVVTKYI